VSNVTHYQKHYILRVTYNVMGDVKMQSIKVQERETQRTSQLYIHLPKFITQHFGLNKGQKLWIDIEGERIVVNLRKPERNAETQEAEQ